MNGSCRLTMATISVVVLGLVATAWIPNAASALTLTVRVDGTGDVPTIQAAFDSLARVGGNGTIMVMAGAYPETLRSGDEFVDGIGIVAPDGPERTSIAAMDLEKWREGEVEGLSILDTLRLGSHAGTWRRCIFAAGVMQRLDPLGQPVFSDCVFRADSHIHFGGGVMERCSFERCTLYLDKIFDFGAKIRDCTFIGPARLGLHVEESDVEFVILSRCTFRDLEDGLDGSFSGACTLEQCVFERIRGRAITLSPPECYESPHCYSPFLRVRNSRFEACGTAIESVNGATNFEALSDTIRDSSGPAIRVAAQSIGIDSLIVDGSRSDGAALTISAVRPYGWSVSIADSRFDRCAARAIDLDGTDIPHDPLAGSGESLVARNQITNSGLDGLHVIGAGFDVRDNLISGNHGSGMVIESVPGYACTDSIAGNTIVANGGWGIEATTGGAPFEGACDAAEAIEHNLVGWNEAGGISVHDPSATARFNDAWMNGGPAYDGFDAGTVNLKVDPQLCDPADGDFHLAADSPCGPSGPFGLIGAFGVGCEASHVAIELEGPKPVIRLDDHGQIKVAILGSRWLDARRIDPATVVVGGASARTHGHASAGSLRDVNGDGRTDLLVVADVANLDLQPGDTSLVVRATARDGAKVEGSARISVASKNGASAALPRIGSDPIPVVLSIAGVQHVVGGFDVRLSLPSRQPALLEAFDVSGRRIASRLLVDQGIGAHDVTMIQAGRMERGIYWLRLRQGEAVATRRVVVTE